MQKQAEPTQAEEVHDRLTTELLLSKDSFSLEEARRRLNDRLTTELLFEKDSFSREEVRRRLKIVGLSEAQIENFIAQEEKIVAASNFCGSQKLALHRWIMPDSSKESLPKVEQLSASELIAITDEALAAWAKEHEWLSKEAYEAVAYIMEAHYQKELARRFEKIGLTDIQRGIFIRNECKILERVRWGYHSNPAWQEG